MLLISLALLFELIEPTFRYFVGYCINHPFGEAAHDVQAVDEEDIGHVLLHSRVESPPKYEANDDEVSPNALRLLWHLVGVCWQTLHEQSAHTGLWIVLAEVLAEVEVAISDCWGRFESVIDAAVPATGRLVQHSKIIQIGVPSCAPVVIDSCVEY